jgi:hypothetical protein
MKRTRILIASILITFFAFAPSARVVAQSDNWTSVKALAKNTDLIITRKNAGRVVGFVQAVSDDTLAIDSDNGSFIIGKDNIEKIYYAEPRDKMKSLNRGALLGMLGGLAAGIGYSIVRPPENESMPGYGIFFLGSGIGMLAGLHHSKGKDKGALIYSAK